MIMKILTWVFVFIAISISSGLQAQGKETHRVYLSGMDNENTKTWDFYCTKGRKSGYWTTIEVPSHWEQQGFGRYDYGRNYVTYGKKYKFHDEEGLYRYEFNVDEVERGKRIYLVFEGSMTDTEVKINGQLAGPIHQGSFYRFEYDVTSLIQFDNPNLLEVKVSKWSANKSVNAAERRADYWIFGGIFRPVYLEILPAAHLKRVAINAEANGLFEMDVYYHLQNNDKAEVVTSIFDQENNQVVTISSTPDIDNHTIRVEKKLSDIHTWNQEKPYLYRVEVSLQINGQEVHKTKEKFGFRTVEIKEGDGIYVNDVKVKMKGINRHVFWPETGRCVNPEIDLLDVKLMKEMNLNAVRCSHYPPDQSFLNICDSLGLYVIDELGGWQNAYDTEVGEKLVKELVIRDVNHPSIIFWSNGNEGGHNFDLDDDYGMYDPSERPVIHAHHRPGNEFNGIDCNHYEDYYSCKNLLEGPNIYMPTEFLHGQDDGGMAAGLYDFWELFWKSDLSGGGFLWVFADEGIVRTDLNGYIDVNRINAPDGVVGPHREKEGSFYAMREIFSPVKFNLEEITSDYDGVIPLENRFHYINLDECTFKWELIDFISPYEDGQGYTVVSEGKLQGPDIAPIETGELNILLPDNFAMHDGWRLTAIHPDGSEIISKTWMIPSYEEEAEKWVPAGEGEVMVSDTGQTIDLSANGITVKINKKDATISGLSNDNSLSLSFTNGPISVGSDTSSIISINHYQEGEGHCVDAQLSGGLQHIKWTMMPTGWIKLDYTHTIDGPRPFAGVTFDYPESHIIGVRWLGNGPYRVWGNRTHGGNLSVYESMYNNTFTGMTPWQYPEFKGYFSDISWVEFNTVEGKFLMVSPEENLHLRLFDFYALSSVENLPAVPSGDISFLDVIPPIGTKLWKNISADASRLGPNSEYKELDGPTTRTLYFYFGLPEKTK